MFLCKYLHVEVLNRPNLFGCNEIALSKFYIIHVITSYSIHYTKLYELLFAFGEATVPKVTVTLRKSYGGAHIVMSCKQLRGDFNYAWPQAEIAVMGAAGAIEVLEGREVASLATEEEKAAYVQKKTEEYQDAFANPYNAASYGYIDDVIEPRNTRFRVIRAFQSLQTKKVVNPPNRITSYNVCYTKLLREF